MGPTRTETKWRAHSAADGRLGIDSFDAVQWRFALDRNRDMPFGQTLVVFSIWMESASSSPPLHVPIGHMGMDTVGIVVPARET